MPAIPWGRFWTCVLLAALCHSPAAANAAEDEDEARDPGQVAADAVVEDAVADKGLWASYTDYWDRKLEEIQALQAGFVQELDEELRGGRRGVEKITTAGDEMPRRSAAALARLRERIWNPIQPLVAKADVVVISNDAVVGIVPWGALPDAAGEFLVERHRIVEQRDLGLLPAMLAGSDRQATGSLVVGGVDYGNDQGSPSEDEPASEVIASASFATRGASLRAWTALPATRREAAEVATRLDTRPLTGADASEAHIKRALERARIVHLATHGFFLGEDTEHLDPEDPAHALTRDFPGIAAGLVCAGGNVAASGSSEDGFLTADELSWLDLRACELLVLSACETARGHARPTEGLMGLQRAAHIAGVDCVISSYWKIPDEATFALMRDFYRFLIEEGTTRIDALRRAQLAAIQRNRAATGGNALPSTWGAFTLSGDWNKLPDRAPRSKDQAEEGPDRDRRRDR